MPQKWVLKHCWPQDVDVAEEGSRGNEEKEGVTSLNLRNGTTVFMYRSPSYLKKTPPLASSSSPRLLLLHSSTFPGDFAWYDLIWSDLVRFLRERREEAHKPLQKEKKKKKRKKRVEIFPPPPPF